MIKSIEGLLEKARQIETKTLVVACAADKHVLEAVELARENNIINGILVGDETEIKRILNFTPIPEYVILTILPLAIIFFPDSGNQKVNEISCPIEKFLSVLIKTPEVHKS